MRHFFSLALFAILAIGAPSATTYLVRPDGTGDFPTIQAALDAAQDGDIVALADGEFNGPGNRDLDYLGKALTVRSQSGVREHCQIDCDGTEQNPHRGFYFHTGEGPGSVLQGVTIFGGNPAVPYSWGGAILCENASPSILDCACVSNRAGWGGGMLFWGSNATVTDCAILDNTVTANGGGIYCTMGSAARFTRVVIGGNVAASGKGGAIACNGCAPIFSQCTLSDNRAAAGGGFWCMGGAQPQFDHTIIAFSVHGAASFCEGDQDGASLNCCDVFGNANGDWTGCIAEQAGVAGNFAADPLFCDRTTRNFGLEWASPCAGDFSPECGLIGALPPACGILINPDGSGSHPTIQAAVDAAANGTTIVLNEGVFTGPGNRDVDLRGKSIRIASLRGQAAGCVIDCQGSESDPHRGFIFDQGETRETVLEEITIMHAYARGPSYRGGALRLVGASPTLRRCVFLENSAESGGAAGGESMALPLFAGCTFARNRATRGGAIHCDFSGPEIDHCTFVGNTADDPSAGGACIECVNYASAVVTNSILVFSAAGEAVYCAGNAQATLSCSDVYGNAGGDWTGGIAGQQGLRGNFAADPRFCGIPGLEYYLSNDSPCLQGACGLVGAWPEGCSEPQDVDEATGLPDLGPMIFGGLPNPFAGATTIRCSIPADWRGAAVTVDVCDAAGRVVRTLAGSAAEAGTIGLVWDGAEAGGRAAPSGIYFLRLREGEPRTTRIVLLRR